MGWKPILRDRLEACPTGSEVCPQGRSLSHRVEVCPTGSKSVPQGRSLSHRVEVCPTGSKSSSLSHRVEVCPTGSKSVPQGRSLSHRARARASSVGWTSSPSRSLAFPGQHFRAPSLPKIREIVGRRFRRDERPAPSVGPFLGAKPAVGDRLEALSHRARRASVSEAVLDRGPWPCTGWCNIRPSLSLLIV